MSDFNIVSDEEFALIERMRKEKQHEEYKYLHLLQDIMEKGVTKSDRTGTGTKSIPHATLSYDLSKGFPLLTTKKMAWKVIKVELEGFIKGITSKKWYQDRGCRIWDEWCNPQKVPYGHDEETKKKMFEEDDLGVIYGSQWRNFNSQGYDQLRNIIDTLKKNPNDRRMVCSAWNPCVLDKVALPSCHYSWCVSVCGDTLNLSYTMRSVDTGCGEPFNQASYSLLCHLLAKDAGLKEGVVTGFLNNVHIYLNHIDGLTEQIRRIPFTPPTIKTEKFTSIFDWEFGDTELVNYQAHPKISLPISV
jgi:thymidylate synthase